MVYIIYKLTNVVNGKEYVGLTKSTLKRRWYQHVHNAKNRSNHLSKAIRKYGKDAFECQALCSCTCVEDAEEMERHFIAEYDTLSNGYNMTRGGSAFTGMPGERNSMYGKTHTPKVRQKLAEGASKRFKGKTYEELYGKKKAAELKQKRSEVWKGVWKGKDTSGINNPRARPVSIRGIEFSHGKAAAAHFGISPSTLVGWLKKYDDCYYL
jgi:group I intron endonuclease